MLGKYACCWCVIARVRNESTVHRISDSSATRQNDGVAAVASSCCFVAASTSQGATTTAAKIVTTKAVTASQAATASKADTVSTTGTQPPTCTSDHKLRPIERGLAKGCARTAPARCCNGTKAVRRLSAARCKAL